MDKIDYYVPSVDDLIVDATSNALEYDDKEWAIKVKRVYKEDGEALDAAFLDVFREWALKNNLL